MLNISPMEVFIIIGGSLVGAVVSLIILGLASAYFALKAADKQSREEAGEYKHGKKKGKDL